MSEKKSNKKNTNKDDKLLTELQEQMEVLNNKVIKLEEEKLMARADLENYKKRIDAQKSQFGAMANMAIITKLMEIIDEINLAVNDEGMDLERAKQVVKMFMEKLDSSLEIVNIEKVEINKGDDVNPNTMEVIATIPSPDFKSKVFDIISSPYRYTGSDQLVKTGKVVAGK